MRLDDISNQELAAKCKRYANSIVKKFTSKYEAAYRTEPTQITKIPGYCAELGDLLNAGSWISDSFEGPIYLVDVSLSELQPMPIVWTNMAFLDEYRSYHVPNIPSDLEDELISATTHAEASAILRGRGINLEPTIYASSIIYGIRPGVKQNGGETTVGAFNTEILVTVPRLMQMLFTEDEADYLLRGSRGET